MTMQKILIGAAAAALLVATVAAAPASAQEDNPLLDPKSEAMNQKAPDAFQVKFETSKGDFVIAVQRDLSPNGVDRFYNLVRHGYYDGVRFFRVISGFMAQFGINGDPAVNTAWINAGIPDDPVRASNKRGWVTFAKRGQPNSRTTQLFINFGDNKGLDAQGFSPFGEVIQGMEVVDALYAEYGDGAPRGKGPDQMRIQKEGNAYLTQDFPKMDYVEKAAVLKAEDEIKPKTEEQ